MPDYNWIYKASWDLLADEPMPADGTSLPKLMPSFNLNGICWRGGAGPQDVTNSDKLPHKIQPWLHEQKKAFADDFELVVVTFGIDGKPVLPLSPLAAIKRLADNKIAKDRAEAACKELEPF